MTENDKALPPAVAEAIREATVAVADQLQRHSSAQMPIHFIDKDGDISERTADGKVRKVTKEEIDAFLRARRA